tara:strand:+ start:722 stop:913 length:192 start_codon:yes stop_codon:yes gene_type:complete
MKTYLVKETKVVTHTYLVKANNIHDALTEANGNLSGLGKSPYEKVDTVVGFPVIDSIQLMEKN